MPWLLSSQVHKNSQLQKFDYFGQVNEQPIPIQMNQMNKIKEEMGGMKQDYEMANERFQNLKDKYDQLQLQYQKDKQFYEDALEARMNQLEELEIQNEQMNRKMEEYQRKEVDWQNQMEKLQFDNDMIQRNLTSNSQEKQSISKREEQLYQENRQLQEKSRECEQEINRLQQDMSRQKNQFDRQNQEIDRLIQNNEFKEQSIQQVEAEKQQYVNQLMDLKQRLSQEQSDCNMVKNHNEEIKNEIMHVKQQYQMQQNLQEQLRQQLYDSRDRISDLEHKEFLTQSSKDMLSREIQQLRSQLTQANQFIQSQSLYFNQAVPQQFQQTWEDISNETNISQSSKQESVKSNRELRKQDTGKEHQQMKSSNINQILQWNDQYTFQKANTQKTKTPINNDNNIAFPSKNQDKGKNIQQQSNTKLNDSTNKSQNYSQEQQNIAFPSQKAKQVQFKQQENETYKPQIKVQSTIQQKVDHEKREKQIQNIESNLLQLNLEKDKYKAEYDKIPENAKTIAQRRRREDLERELSILLKNISSLKTKLRELQATH